MIITARAAHQPSLCVVRHRRDRLALHAEAEQTQVDDENGAANQGESHQMNRRDDRKKDRRLPHRVERTGILQPAAEL
jgi:hypothetical protein